MKKSNNNDIEKKINSYIQKILHSNSEGNVNDRMITVLRLEIISMFENIVKQLGTDYPAPDVNVEMTLKKPYQARIVLFDKETEEKIALKDWIDKCMERL